MVAYEPVWAIGTGMTPTDGRCGRDAPASSAALLERRVTAAQGVRILYGGSVKPSNAAELMAVADVNGALVGGASLKADDFLGDCQGARPDRAVEQRNWRGSIAEWPNPLEPAPNSHLQAACAQSIAGHDLIPVVPSIT